MPHRGKRARVFGRSVSSPRVLSGERADVLARSTLRPAGERQSESPRTYRRCGRSKPAPPRHPLALGPALASETHTDT
jgi:hypothetical protein